MGLLKNLSGVRPSRVLRRSAPPRRAFRGPDRREKAQGPRRGTLPGPLRWLGAGLGFLVRALLTAWASLAIYYSNLPWPGLRLALAVAFAAFAVWALWLSRRRRMPAALVVLFLGVVGVVDRHPALA